MPFNAVQVTNKNDALKNAKGFKYDRNEMKCVPEESSATTGAPANPSQRR